MGDSDEELDRSRDRDKFRRERSDYGSGDKRSSRSESYRDRRPTWREDRRRSRDEYDSDRRRSYSGYSRGRDWSPPPQKRARRSEWDSLRDYSGPGMMAPYGLRPPWPIPPPAPVPSMIPGLTMDSQNSAPQATARHMMLTFKQFLAQQDDSIDEQEAIASYNEYKAEFRRKQVDEFFESHKDEDWFMSLYHPTNLAEAKKEAAAHLRSRLAAFTFLLESGRLDKVSLSQDHTKEVVKVMDTAVIMMEGTEADLLSLEMKTADEEGVAGEGEEDNKEEKPAFMNEPSEEDLKLAKMAKQYGKERSKSDSESEDKDSNGTPPPDGEEFKSNGDAGENRVPAQASSAGTGQPRPLHLTHSVYIRHIPPKVSAEDIIKVCKAFPGFLRVAFAEVNPEKGYERRGWVTFAHSTDIKSVCAQLGSLKVKDCQLSCSVNRDLTRRVKHAPPAAWARKAVHSDLHEAIKLVRFLDKKAGLWEDSSDDVVKGNPVLDIEDSLLGEEEEADAEMTEDEEGAIVEISSTDVLDEDNRKLKVLERVLWYLRLVHSLDFYNGMLFTTEDKMPHRCGIITVRSEAPLSISAEDLSKYCEEVTARIEPLLAQKKLLSDAEMEKFGQKDAESEAERFIELNTQKLSENKYLCPLSGKKFKGPEFVKKHIFNKHMEKVEAVKKEVEFFNNYLRDCERPMPLEASIKSSVLPPNPKTPSAEESPTLGMISPLGGSQAPGSAGAAWGEAHMMQMFGRGGGGRGFGGVRSYSERGRGGRRGRGRRQIDYHDLDAPDEVEIY